MIHVRLLASNLDYKNHLCTLHITSGNLHELKASRVSLRKQRLPCALRHDKQSRRFSNSRGLSASVSFLSSQPPPRLLGPFFARSLTVKTARKRLLRRLQRITHFCYRRTIRLKQENFSCNDKTNYTTRHKFITHKNNCCQVFSRSRNDQPLFVNEYKVNVG